MQVKNDGASPGLIEINENLAIDLAEPGFFSLGAHTLRLVFASTVKSLFSGIPGVRGFPVM